MSVSVRPATDAHSRGGEGGGGAGGGDGGGGAGSGRGGGGDEIGCADGATAAAAAGAARAHTLFNTFISRTSSVSRRLSSSWTSSNPHDDFR